MEIFLKRKKYYIVLACTFAIIFGIGICYSIKGTQSLKETSATVLSNKKIGWGIKRNDNHERPDVGSENQRLLQENNGICLGNEEKKYIYLTFDLGYEAGYTEKILDSLKENNVQGTFFITAHYVNSASDILQRMIDEGHIIGNHTVNHKSMPDLSDSEMKKEIMDLNKTVFEKYGYEMKYLRPPKGEFSQRSLSITNSLGFRTVMWSFAYVDWNENSQPSSEEALNKIISNLHNGEIMLLHATSKTNAEIMNQMIKEVREQGYEFRSLDEFM